MTTIYFMRHSEALKYNNINNNDTLQIQNEKWPLTIKGEKIAKEKSKIEEFLHFDIVYSSSYVRAISTAKYFTNDKVNIDESFGERKFENFDYKLNDGESLNEVIFRELNSLNRILNDHKNQKILVVGHSTALASLFSKWCEVSYGGPYKFNEKEFFDGKWNYCETFKLMFDEYNNLIDIKRVQLSWLGCEQSLPYGTI